MARTALAPTLMSADGIAVPTASAANADGHSIIGASRLGGRVDRLLLMVDNGSGADVDVTILAGAGHSMRASLGDKVVTVGAGDATFIIFEPGRFEQADGSIHVDFEAVTSVTVYALAIPNVSGQVA